MSPADLIPILLTLAWLAPLAGCVATWVVGKITIERSSKLPAWIAIGAMAISLNLVMIAAGFWWQFAASGQYGLPPASGSPLSGTYYTLGEFGSLNLTLDYYIDSLTILMFGVITLIATAVHVYSVAYIKDGHPDDAVEDHPQPTVPELSPLAAIHDAQPTEYSPQLPRFFAQLQFFTFAMLGLILAGNLLQVFVFWELAAAAATKAFLFNRVGDAGFVIGIVFFLTFFGQLSFGERTVKIGYAGQSVEGTDPGILTANASGIFESRPDEFRKFGWLTTVPEARSSPKRWMFVFAGLCLFAGCVGKSAQLPLSTWLPDAMAGPTPVSALVHSATMVAAGVYLVGRVYPLFLPEVLLVIAYVGAITLVYGATCAVVQTDLKRILAYSTISQLGYMMLAMGVGGREAGLFHLVTHAFFKSLLFLAAGSVIVACHHVQDVSRLGGLRKRMPITAYTSLVGVIAIAGLAIPLIAPFGEAIALSGYHSKDSILAAALSFAKQNPAHGLLFALPLVTAGLTAFYMFRFWLLAFAGEPRDEELHRHVHESSPLMTAPLVLLAIFAAFCAIGGEHGPLFETIAETAVSPSPPLPLSHSADIHGTASLWGLLAATIGAAAALAAYGAGLVDMKRSIAFFGPIRGFFASGWRLDALYRMLFVRPLEFLAFCGSLFDRFVLDGVLHGVSRLTLAVARFDRTFDERVVDGLVNRIAMLTYDTGLSLRQVQSGRLRQYVMALAAAAVVLFALAVVLIPKMT